MPDHFITPELFVMLVNNGLGGVAVLLLLQVNARIGRVVAIITDHENRITTLERRAGVVPSKLVDA